MKKTFLVTTLLTILCFASMAQAESLRVVTLLSPPIAFEEKGEVVGLGVDIINEALSRMGDEASISIMPWKRAVHTAQYGNADAIFYMIKNRERDNWFHFPEEPLVMETTVIVSRAGQSLDITQDRAFCPHLRLGIGRGYYYGPNIKRFLENSTFKAVEETTTIQNNYDKLMAKHIDVFLSDLTLAEHFIKKYASRNSLAIITNPDNTPMVLDSVKSHLAFSKMNIKQEKAALFSRTLHEMKKDGTYDAILGKYR